jgi:hypothetical protein
MRECMQLPACLVFLILQHGATPWEYALTTAWSLYRSENVCALAPQEFNENPVFAVLKVRNSFSSNGFQA